MKNHLAAIALAMLTMVSSETLTLTQTIQNDGSVVQSLSRSLTSSVTQPTFWDYFFGMF